MEHVIFGDGAGGDAFRRVGGEVFVFVEEALLRYVGAHFVLSLVRFRLDGWVELVGAVAFSMEGAQRLLLSNGLR